ncbi:uncharacterized protein LAESUDRAFT_795181 [Laetiporus sulphureus 93-53]|uniref:Protein kinase domain-containing protein n=1 Tax=Laetiporus sulphureus 93-53 TaxID=1314785 RepID=A0A165BZ80_9APHY|nr:uncharacterized protein LAESUDRAFT_795181 [Laetiporus sulphureus 93-53]KZT01918.1 hypothetical protein LAESUDRAFT_795181 [Laetiporus sulphureus 93-53]
METPGEVCKWLVYSLLCVAADAFDTILSVVASNGTPKPSLLPSDVDELGDNQILELRQKAPDLPASNGIFWITPHTKGKASQDFEEDAADASEANTLNLVFVKTSIPVPRIRRVVKRKWDHLIVMDYVRGPTLAEIWPKSSIWKKIYVAFTLHRYVRQLRCLKASPTTPPGPLSVQGPRTCESPISVRSSPWTIRLVCGTFDLFQRMVQNGIGLGSSSRRRSVEERVIR